MFYRFELQEGCRFFSSPLFFPFSLLLLFYLFVPSRKKSNYVLYFPMLRYYALISTPLWSTLYYTRRFPRSSNVTWKSRVITFSRNFLYIIFFFSIKYFFPQFSVHINLLADRTKTSVALSPRQNTLLTLSPPSFLLLRLNVQRNFAHPGRYAWTREEGETEGEQEAKWNRQEAYRRNISNEHLERKRRKREDGWVPGAHLTGNARRERSKIRGGGLAEGWIITFEIRDAE